ncbi:MAG: carboxymuconolactone decarboxylase family protein [Proteobacteria bacterium]|nr:carboxymuconolactone decarboxylase family protein [Pseudomonadota bacterium]MDA1059418.1 carboxymuconolactone decarboxylase family protein [Pseudomonadota bacterium]
MADELAKGIEIRRSILGDEHVARSQAATTSFNEPFQRYITRSVWEDVWGRPTIAPGIRRLLTLIMMIALNRPEEFKLHVRAAIHGGLTAADIREVILQAAAYCGVPAANSAIKWAEEVFAALGLDVDSAAQQELSFAP